MFCQKCGARIEDGCLFCVACGAKVEQNVTEATPVQPKVQPIPVQPEVQGAVPVEAPNPVYANQQNAMPNSFDYMNYNQNPEEPPKKAKKKPGKWLKPVVAIVLVVAILAGTFFALKDYIVFGIMGVLPAETQLQYVYSRAANDFAEEIALPVEKVREFVVEDETIEGEYKVKIGEGIMSLLSQKASVDLSKFNTVAVDYKITKKDNLAYVNLGYSIGGESLFSFDVYYDSKNGKLTVEVPELDTGVLEIDVSEYTEGYAIEEEAYKQAEEYLMTVLPSPELIEKLLPKYVEIAFKQITKVTRTSDTLSVNGVSQKVTTLKAEIDEETIQNMLVEMAKEFAKDKDIKKYIMTVIEKTREMVDLDETLDYTPQEVYDEFTDAMDDVIDALEEMDLDFGDVDVLFVTHTDGKGDIVGVSFEIENGNNELVVEYLTVQSGSNCAMAIRADMDGNEMFLIGGKGTKKNDKFTGEISIEVMQKEMVNLKFTDFDVKSYKEGYPKGTIEIELDGVLSLVAGRVEQSGLPGVTSASVILDFDCSKKKTAITVTVEALGFEIGEISFTASKSKAEKLTMPKDTTDDIEEWASNISLDALTDILKDSGLYDIIEKSMQSNQKSNAFR